MQNQDDASTRGVSPFMPYSPKLREILKSYGASLLLIYFEQHFPASQDSPNAPFLVDIDRTQHALMVKSKVFWNHLWMLAVGWRSAKRRAIARQAGREFLTTAVRGSGAYKPYSYLRVDPKHIEVTRNHSRIRQLLAQAGLCDSDQPEPLLRAEIVSDHGFQSFRANSGREMAAELARSLAPLSDGRRKAGLKRRFAPRAAWTEERRERFRRTMIERGYWSVDKRAISDVPNE